MSYMEFDTSPLRVGGGDFIRAVWAGVMCPKKGRRPFRDWFTLQVCYDHDYSCL